MNRALAFLLLAGMIPALPSRIAVANPDAGTAATGVCVAFSTEEQRPMADSAIHLLGPPAERIDVRDASQAARLRHECARLIIAIGAPALSAARGAPPTARIVSALVPAPQTILDGSRLTAAVLQDIDPAQAIGILLKVAPTAKRVGVVYDPAKTGGLVAAGREAAKALGVELVALPAGSIGEAVRAFHRFEKEVSIDALWLLPDSTTTVQETVYYAMELAHWRRMAVIGLSHWYVANGALFALVPNTTKFGTRAAELARKILAGAKIPAVSYAQDYSLLVNSRTAQRLGLKIPGEIQDRAENVTP